MTFNSLTFVAFFSVVFALHQLPLPWSIKKLSLVLASYVFYAAWNPPFIGLLLLSTVIDWTAARRIAGSSGFAARRFWLWSSVLANLGMLGFFKYGTFAVENVAALLARVGIEYQASPLNIVLPWGISFYTFQSMSYTIDVYRGQQKPWKSFLDFALYIAFFPQLLAGPIMRAHDFLPQCVRPRPVSVRAVGWGLSLTILGLFLKTVVSDSLVAPVADAVFADASTLGALDAWCGVFAFFSQVYCDFCGYSTCAIGLGICLGFSLPDNFHCPFASRGFSEFWQRWHITLYTWFRDYVYIPLGGSRRGFLRTCVNLLITFALCGLWHGAAWTFIAFGVIHGMLLVLEVGIRLTPLAQVRVWKTRGGQFALAAMTFVGVTITCVFFRARSFAQAARMLAAMFGVGDTTRPELLSTFDLLSTCVVVELLFLSHWALRDTTTEAFTDRFPWWARSFVLAGMMAAILLAGTEDRAFIYFQF